MTEFEKLKNRFLPLVITKKAEVTEEECERMAGVLNDRLDLQEAMEKTASNNS